MNRADRSISVRSIPRSRTIDLDLPDGIRIVELSSGRLYVRTINKKTIIAGPSYLLYRDTRPIEIRSDSDTTGRIIDVPLSDLDLIAVASTGLRIEGLCDPEAGFRTIGADRALLASTTGRFDVDVPPVGSLAYDRLRLDIGLLLIDLYEKVAGRRECDGAPSANSDQTDIRKIHDEIVARYDSEFSLAELAGRCGMTPTSFARAFKRECGVSVFELIHKTRVERACLLLKRNDRPIIEIACDVGYNNVSFFNRCFKKIIGTSPAEYRRASR